MEYCAFSALLRYTDGRLCGGAEERQIISAALCCFFRYAIAARCTQRQEDLRSEETVVRILIRSGQPVRLNGIVQRC